MNCTNCGRLKHRGLCSVCDGEPPVMTDHDYMERQTAALESIAESLRNLPTKRELLAAIIVTEPECTVGSAIRTADAIIAACKEKEDDTNPR